MFIAARRSLRPAKHRLYPEKYFGRTIFYEGGCVHLLRGYPSSMRTATCHCKKLTLECRGESTKISLCHCFDCQRRTGSLFSVSAFFPKTNVSLVEGEAKIFTRHSASGCDVTFYFRSECGSNLWWNPERLPELTGVAAGSFADRDFPMPQQAVWTVDQHCWLQLPDKIPSYRQNPFRVAPKG